LSSVVTTYRLQQETKDKIKAQLGSLGLTQEEYFNKVISIMELEKVKQNTIFAVNTTELQDLTSRLYNLFIGLCDQGNSFLSNKDSEILELKNSYKDVLLNKENIISSLKKEVEDVSHRLNVLQKEGDKNKKDLIKVKDDYKTYLNQLEMSLKDKSSLLEEYKQKNQNLLHSVEKYKQYKNEVEELKSNTNSLMDTIKSNNKTIKDSNEYITELKDKYTNDIAMIKDKLTIEKDKSILDLDKNHQKHLEMIHNKYNEEIQSYQEKYKNLLEQIDKNPNINLKE
jgi:chromosome segregation ATPase